MMLEIKKRWGYRREGYYQHSPRPKAYHHYGKWPSKGNIVPPVLGPKKKIYSHTFTPDSSITALFFDKKVKGKYKQ